MRPLLNQSNEDDLSIGEERQGAFILNSIRPIDERTEIIDVLYEETQDKSHLWLATYSSETKRNKIEDLTNPTLDSMWDRE